MTNKVKYYRKCSQIDFSLIKTINEITNNEGKYINLKYGNFSLFLKKFLIY